MAEHIRKPIPRRATRGAVLLEALVAFSVLAVGLLSLARWQLRLQDDGAIAAARSEAVRLAESELETLRAQVGPSPSGASLFAAIASERRDVPGADGRTGFRLTRAIETTATFDAKLASIDIGWTDRAGRSLHIAVASVLAPNDPALIGAAAVLPPAGRQAPGGAIRDLAVPLEARDLGDGRSAWKPTDAGTLAYLFDNASGRIVGRCEHVGADTGASSTPTAATLGTCDRLDGLLLGGIVRFTSAAPPNPQDADDPPRPFAIQLTLTGGGYPLAPSCSVQSMKTYTASDRGQTRTSTAASGTTPPNFGGLAWTETGERYARYACAVFPRADGRWSGRADLVADGWTIGAGAGRWRVCRRVADLDRSGAIDANREHPAVYAAVDGTLANQNYLVIRGDQTCPAPGAAPHQP